ncbi:MAG: hypothetical protein WAK33_07560, partial [Silvibacterium sp.]
PDPEMPEMSSRVQPSLRAQGRDIADALRTSTGIQGRLPFKPKVMGSIPTAPTKSFCFQSLRSLPSRQLEHRFWLTLHSEVEEGPRFQ